MKKFLRITALACAGITAAALSGCGEKAELLGKPEAASPLSYQTRQSEDYRALSAAAENFAARFAPAVGQSIGNRKNFAVSPVSVYMALALSAECASGETRGELLNVLRASRELLQSEIGNLYNGLNAEYRRDNKLIARLTLGNSIWVQKDAHTKQECIETLAQKYYCYSYSADFFGDNAGANKAVRKFVKEQTNGMIDQDFDLDIYTRFALMNTLYLKDVWNTDGDDLSLTGERYDFRQGDGTEKPTNLLQGYYRQGRAYEAETFTHFYTSTHHGYRIKFLLPKEGYSAEEVFTAENISLVNSISDYNAIDEENEVTYSTRCLFPEFTADFDGDIKEVLKGMGVERFFIDGGCEFETLTDESVYCEKVQHVVKLEVEKSGIEGAAVTIVQIVDESAPGEVYETVLEDFVVDRAFGFLLTDPYGATLFSGIVSYI